MVTINSLSGGKTSSYMALHYPADHNLFALVCNDDPKCGHPDKKIMQIANDKLGQWVDVFGEFVGTPEDIKILKVMLDLEQMMGEESKWIRGESFDKIIANKKRVPNFYRRYCTGLLKIEPIFWYCYLYTELPVEMRIGFRYDEKERAEKSSNKRGTMKFRRSQLNSRARRAKWDTIYYRENSYPLIRDKISTPHVDSFWEDRGIDFPVDSNCIMCIFKHEQQLRKNFDDQPAIMEWAQRMESSTPNGVVFSDTKIPLRYIRNIKLDEDFLFGGGAGCQAGYCTD